MSVTYTYNEPEGNQTVIEVAFTDGIITHVRDVNAVFANGSFDAEATETRISEVAMGIENKIAVGAITQRIENPAEANTA